MDWAIDSSRDHVKAGTPAAYQHLLRCPVCEASVYHRHGNYNRPHFAHYSRNFSLACELYQPGTGSVRPKAASPHSKPPTSAGPAVVWVDQRPIPLSLQLRLPKVADGYRSTLAVCSSLGRAEFSGEELSRTSFAQLSLSTPPAKVETSPVDPGLAMRVEAALSQFCLSGNYFRVTATGGVLEKATAPLQLGEEYVLVTQRPLRSPCPPALIHTEPQKQHRSWTIYRLRLRDSPEHQAGDIIDLKYYLARAIAPSKPRVDIVWPPPIRFDLDGSPIFADTVTQLIVRSWAPTIHAAATQTDVAVKVNKIADAFYQVDFCERPSELAIWLDSGFVRTIRFLPHDLTGPRGAMVIAHEAVNLFSTEAAEHISRTGYVDLVVPSELLWRKLRIDDVAVRPVPDGLENTFSGSFGALDLGSFGSVHVPRKPIVVSEQPRPWHHSLSQHILRSLSPAASGKLADVCSKEQAVRWAMENNASHALPFVLTALSSESTHGVS